jgi:cobalt-precorrin-7 (C5)-methyltransferase
MIIIGVGCGPGLLTQQAIRAIGEATLIYGSKRAIGLAQECIAPSAEVRSIEDYSRLDELPEHAVVLSTGDPMLAGLGRPGHEVIPGISSMQVAFAHLGLSLVRSTAITAHGTAHGAAIGEAIQELKSGKTVFLLAEPSFPFGELMDRLCRESVDCRVAVCEELGYPEERIAVGTAKNPPEVRSKLYSVILGKW